MSIKSNVRNVKAIPFLLALMLGVPAHAAPATPPELVDALNGVFGKHAGARAVHAKGVVAEGIFTPDPAAASISKAIHYQSGAVPVTVRFSNFAGIPDIPDNHGLASPHGMAIKFLLKDGTETDLVTHSFNGFPSPTAEDFRDLLQALAASGPDAKKPTQLDGYLGSHPAAKNFLTAPKPAPVSFGTTSYFGINTFKFINAKGDTNYGRYQIIPLTGNQSLNEDQSKKVAPNYLETELKSRLAKNPVKFTLQVELAQSTDNLNDPSITWSSSNKKIKLGTIEIDKLVDDSKSAEKVLVFMPNRLTPGIEVQDPMINARSNAYAVSFGRRSK